MFSFAGNVSLKSRQILKKLNLERLNAENVIQKI